MGVNPVLIWIKQILVGPDTVLRMIWRAVVLVLADGLVCCGAGEPRRTFYRHRLADLSVRIWCHDIAGLSEGILQSEYFLP